MGSEQNAEYYDQVYKSRHLESWRDYRKPRVKLFIHAASQVPDECPLVVDLGCGPGLFAQCLDELNPPMMYSGFDFSRRAVKQARERGIKMPHEFTLADLTGLDTEPGQHIPESTLFVIMETLEHIADDFHILNLVPPGCQVLVSVPQFDDPGHVRHFPTWEHVSARYARFLEVEDHTEVWKWFVFKAKRNNEKA